MTVATALITAARIASKNSTTKRCLLRPSKTTTNIRSKTSHHLPRRSMSSAAHSTSQSNDTSMDHHHKAYQMYGWGTNEKGIIPVRESLEKGRSGETVGGSGLLGRSGNILDHPQRIDLKDAFDVDNESITVKSIKCGPTGTAVLLSNNTCYTFGSNNSGQLGHPKSQTDVLVPTLLDPPDASPLHHDEISQIELGSNFSAVIDIHGNLYTFGHNGSVIRKEGAGCLGHGYFPEEYKYTPTLVHSLVEDNCYAKQVAVGSLHMTVLTTEGEVLTCGAGAYGRCGNLDTVDQMFLEPVELLAGEADMKQIVGGKDFTLALSGRDGIVFAWGRNHKGQCGTGSGLAVDVYAMEPMPVPVEGLLEGRRVVKVAAGVNHAAAITDKGELFTWGLGMAVVPEQKTELLHTKVVDVACGQDYTVAVGEDGTLYSFGKGKTGVLGLASEKKAAVPTIVEELKGKKVVQVSAGWTHVACLVEEDEA